MQIQIIFIIIALCTLGYIIDLTRRKKLQARYALLWLFLWTLGIFFAVFQTDFLRWVARAIGVYAPENAFFLLAIIFLTWLCLHLTVMVSLLDQRNRLLAQKLAQLEFDVREEKDK